MQIVRVHNIMVKDKLWIANKLIVGQYGNDDDAGNNHVEHEGNAKLQSI